MVPPKPCARKSLCQKFIEMIPHPFHASYWRNNRPFLFFLFILAAVNIILFIHRAYYFKDFSMLNGFTPNPFYLLSRACGKNLLISFFLNGILNTFPRAFPTCESTIFFLINLEILPIPLNAFFLIKNMHEISVLVYRDIHKDKRHHAESY